MSINVQSSLKLLDQRDADSETKCRLAEQVALNLLQQNDGLTAKVRRALMASNTESAQGVVEAVKFLWLVAADRSRNWTPAHRVDLVWHEMILFTRGYDRLCREHFGGFVHHQPSENHSENQRAFESTLAAYRLSFGESNEAFWGNRRTALAACGACDAQGE